MTTRKKKYVLPAAVHDANVIKNCRAKAALKAVELDCFPAANLILTDFFHERDGDDAQPATAVSIVDGATRAYIMQKELEVVL